MVTLHVRFTQEVFFEPEMAFLVFSLDVKIDEPPLGVIREQGEWLWRRKGA